jgi:hypothetical protein
MRQSIVIMLFRFTFDRIHIILLYGISVLSLIVGLIFFFLTIFQCSPVEYYWNRLTMTGHCIDIDILVSIVYFYSAAAAACDLTIGLLPALLIRNLRVTRRTKLGIAVILGIGCMYVRFQPIKLSKPMITPAQCQCGCNCQDSISGILEKQ